MDDKEEIEDVKKDVMTMQLFLREYMDYSEKANIKRSSNVNILDLINDIISSSKTLEQKIKIVCTKKILFSTDKNCLHRIILNLCENASKYADEILVTITKNKSGLRIDIDDDGPGIPNYKKKEVFKPFYRIDNSRNLNQAGTGLGLSIANELVKTLNGRIELMDSKKLGGALFTIKLQA